MVSQINGTSAASSAPSTSSGSTGANASDRLGKQDFLQLLIAQLKNQDPMKPMEDKEFIAQLAQFSSLETLQSLDKRLESFSDAQQFGQAAAAIGKRVQATLTDGTKLNGVVSEVRFAAGITKLVVNNQEVLLSQVTSLGGP
jgi:flagellar basal-body rod modification protein FlgD